MRALRGICRLLLAFAFAFAFAYPVHLVDGFGTTAPSPLLSLSERPGCDRIEEHLQIQTQSQMQTQLQTTPSLAVDSDDSHKRRNNNPWATARKALRDPGCCIVSVCNGKYNGNSNSNSNGNDNDNDNNDESHRLDAHLTVLQDRLADRGPSDMDIRARIDTTTINSATEDCLEVCRSMFVGVNVAMAVAGGNNLGGRDKSNSSSSDLVPSAAALAAFAMGMASFAEDCCGTNTNTTQRDGDGDGGVFLRIVCASSYRAHDPVFHTDKAPLRGYATLRGVGTEFATAPCSPLEYLALRTLGTQLNLPRFDFGVPGTDTGNSEPTKNLRRAAENEFIVMKGDYYYRSRERQTSNKTNSHPTSTTTTSTAAAADTDTASSWWQRAFACVHRSPPGGVGGGRRFILSFDLADGDDDREWHDAHQKRKWRAGMTQRKSKLVA